MEVSRGGQTEIDFFSGWKRSEHGKVKYQIAMYNVVVYLYVNN